MPGIAVVFLDLVAYQEAILEKQRECGRDHGLGNALIDGEQQDMARAGRVVRSERLGGLLSCCHRKTVRQERIE
jgi:hypothetical protein